MRRSLSDPAISSRVPYFKIQRTSYAMNSELVSSSEGTEPNAVEKNEDSLGNLIEPMKKLSPPSGTSNQEIDNAVGEAFEEVELMEEDESWESRNSDGSIESWCSGDGDQIPVCFAPSTTPRPDMLFKGSSSESLDEITSVSVDVPEVGITTHSDDEIAVDPLA